MISMRDMLEAGCHFGHQTRFWNPKMAQYIFGARNKIHIINLEKTVVKFEEACKFARELSARGGKILFVDAKRGGREIIAEEAQRAGCAWVDQRWLGGTLTNFKTVKGTIKRLKDMEQQLADGTAATLTKKEALDFSRNVEKLNKSIGGIKEMTGLPDALFVVDVGYHKIAIQEANKLGIPVIGVVDTNHSPDGIDYVIPGNDDASKAVAIYAKGIADAVIAGRNDSLEEVVEAAKDEEFVEVAAEETPAASCPLSLRPSRDAGLRTFSTPVDFYGRARFSPTLGVKNGCYFRRDGQGIASEDRRADDGMQEGPYGSRRRHGQG